MGSGRGAVQAQALLKGEQEHKKLPSPRLKMCKIELEGTNKVFSNT